tara:strand:- start:332 stop:523 length:192 start_codon:yes stop_codon:yes gene_type:complete
MVDYLLVISLWGYDGLEWIYVGNQIVFNVLMTLNDCQIMADNWSKHELNEFYRLSLECVNQNG